MQWYWSPVSQLSPAPIPKMIMRVASHTICHIVCTCVLAVYFNAGRVTYIMSHCVYLLCTCCVLAVYLRISTSALAHSSFVSLLFSLEQAVQDLATTQEAAKLNVLARGLSDMNTFMGPELDPFLKVRVAGTPGNVEVRQVSLAATLVELSYGWFWRLKHLLGPRDRQTHMLHCI